MKTLLFMTGCALILLALISGCSKQEILRFADENTNSDIVSSPVPENKNIDAEIYFDATTSMEGFAKNQGSIYNIFVKELEAGLKTGTTKSDISFYKFGSRIKQITRDEAIKQKSSAFFNEKGIYERTCVDSVLNGVDTLNTRIIITDLFQSEGDINQLVGAFKDKCFANKVDVSILMIKSQFNGKVFDARVPPYSYASQQDQPDTYRPFYVIMTGKYNSFIHIINTLKSTAISNAIVDDQFLALPVRLVSDYQVDLNKKSRTKRFVKRSFDGKNPFKNIFQFDLNKGEGGEPLIANLTVTPHKYVPPLELANMEVVSTKLVSGSKKGDNDTPTNDLKLVKAEAKDNQITANMTYEASDVMPNASYKIYYRLSPLSGYKIPEKFTANSSDNPTATSESNMTLNLTKFITDLIRAYASENNGYIGKSYLYLKIK